MLFCSDLLFCMCCVVDREKKSGRRISAKRYTTLTQVATIETLNNLLIVSLVTVSVCCATMPVS